MQILTMLIPGLRAILGTTPMGLADLAVVAGTSVLPLLINEGTKKKRGDQNCQLKLLAALLVSKQF